MLKSKNTSISTEKLLNLLNNTQKLFIEVEDTQKNLNKELIKNKSTIIKVLKYLAININKPEKTSLLLRFLLRLLCIDLSNIRKKIKTLKGQEKLSKKDKGLVIKLVIIEMHKKFISYKCNIAAEKEYLTIIKKLTTIEEIDINFKNKINNQQKIDKKFSISFENELKKYF